MSTRLQSPLRVGFCITDLDPGGAERCLVELVTRLDRDQFTPTVYCLGPRPADNPTSLAAVLAKSLVKTHFLGALRDRGSASRVEAAKAVRHRRPRDRANILVSRECRWRSGRSLGQRATGGDGNSGCRAPQRVASRAVRWSDRWVDRHVCVSESVRDFSARTGGLPLEKLLVIPNGVNFERFADATPSSLEPLGIAAGRRALAFVGRLEEQKGLPWLFEQLPAIFRQLPQHDLLLIGIGPQCAMLGALAAKLGFADRVHFAGFRGDVPEILAASDVLVLTSRWEGMPNVVLEAMAAGKPVVTTDVEGVAELLGPDDHEQLVNQDDSEAFIQKVVAICGDPQLADRLGRQNQQRGQTQLSLDCMVIAYQQLYRSLAPLGKRSPGN